MHLWKQVHVLGRYTNFLFLLWLVQKVRPEELLTGVDLTKSEDETFSVVASFGIYT